MMIGSVIKLRGDSTIGGFYPCCFETGKEFHCDPEFILGTISRLLQLKEKLIDQIKGEVETYDQYLSGDVYGYQISKDDNEFDSCWGYYGLKYF